MEASICIVSRNRKVELEKTLLVLHEYLKGSCSEILVFLDGCSDFSEDLIQKFPDCYWEVSKKSIGASPARNSLYKKAQGTLIFGFDDDAHPLQSDFVERAKRLFKVHKELGIITFEEIKGVFESDHEALLQHQKQKDFFCSEFVGCGFVICKEVYGKTDGFPLWMDIYGEESSVSIQVVNEGYTILYTTNISVNHRVDKTYRGHSGYNYTRFQKQLTNTTLFYIVHYPFSLVLKRLIKLYWHNFRKYGIKNRFFFKAFVAGGFQALIKFFRVLKFRKVVKMGTLQRMRNLSLPVYG